LLRKLFGKAERRAVDLGPVEQVILGHLLRFDAAGADTLMAALTSVRPAGRDDLAAALARLSEAGLVETRHRLEDEGPLYVAAGPAKRLRGRLSPDPRTEVRFYL
jgi:DNA-binding MarR family transcriptional regulator